jgi:very-short-patch-repair endonuclease
MPERPYNATLTSRARELRTSATKQENRLWYEFLRDFHPRFTRQRIVGSYILDFYCGTVKLAVELDGSGHFEPEAIEYDKIRTKFLESLGIRVIRFTNIEVNESFEGYVSTLQIKFMPS